MFRIESTDVYSLNAAIPAAAIEQRDELLEHLESFETVRDPLTLVIKRFGTPDSTALSSLERSLGEVLNEWGPMRAEIDGIDLFMDPPSGPSPVIYLGVSSHGLEALHRDLVDRFGVVDPAIEGENYIPHITIARGGPRVAIDELRDISLETHQWTIETVMLWSSRHDKPVKQFSLPYRS